MIAQASGMSDQVRPARISQPAPTPAQSDGRSGLPRCPDALDRGVDPAAEEQRRNPEEGALASQEASRP